MKKIIVMSGSFNPPTIMHHKAMLAALEVLDASKGIYVPTPAKSLRYKMRKYGFPDEVISEELRIRMLHAMSEDDSRLEVSDIECRHAKWHAMETMRYFKSIYPDSELYYLIGSDNLAMFLRSHRLVEFLTDFHFAVVIRNREYIEPFLAENNDAFTRRERFEIIPSPIENDGISSTLVREYYRLGIPDTGRMLHPKVAELMQETTIYKNFQ